MFSEPPFLLADLFLEKLQSGVKIQIIFGKNSKISECNDLVDKLKLNKPHSNPLVDIRLCEKVITNIVVSEKGACLILGNKNNEADMLNAVVGKSKRFITWCNDYFSFKWNQGEPISRIRSQVLN